MKKILFLMALTYSVSSISQTVQSSCSGPDSVIWKYRNDADKMAVRYVYHIGSTYKDSIAINKQIRDNYLRALIAVYNATAIPARDSVIKMFNIHIHEDNVNSIVLRADSNLQWMKNIRTNVLPCGNTPLDNLISKYYLKKQSYWHNLIAPNADVVFKADTNCNIDALADTIRNISGVLIASNTWGFGSGNKIEDSLTSNSTWLVYSYGWGDCNNGCAYRKFWQFKVYNDCSVEYGGTYGAPLNVGVSENNLDYANVKVYPNPASGKLNIAFEATQTKEVKLSIINPLGQIIYSLNDLDQKEEIEISFLPVGIYFLKLENEKSFKVVKILKE